MAFRLDPSLGKRLARLRKKLKQRPKDSSIRSNVAWLLTMPGDRKAAEALLQKGLSMAPDDPCLLNNLANLSVLDAEVDKALQYYQRAVHSDPEQTGRVYANLAMV